MQSWQSGGQRESQVQQQEIWQEQNREWKERVRAQLKEGGGGGKLCTGEGGFTTEGENVKLEVIAEFDSPGVDTCCSVSCLEILW